MSIVLDLSETSITATKEGVKIVGFPHLANNVLLTGDLMSLGKLLEVLGQQIADDTHRLTVSHTEATIKLIDDALFGDRGGER